ncbi:hypothetical protein M8J77_005025 [Diaphorina citri]|nr:hypothetical protein M8J77_005025 [Diaphorina citri]
MVSRNKHIPISNSSRSNKISQFDHQRSVMDMVLEEEEEDIRVDLNLCDCLRATKKPLTRWTGWRSLQFDQLENTGTVSTNEKSTWSKPQHP